VDIVGKNILYAIAPFAAWILMQTLLPATAWAYAARSAATAIIATLAFRRLARTDDAVASPGVRGVAAGLATGLAVCALWILPDDLAWYRTWMCWPIGSNPVATGPSPYDPATCGWPLTITKLVGSAFVIAPVEELFFRSFLYRWLQNRDFTTVPLSRFDMSAFMWTIFLFMLEHDRPAAAAMAGAAYGFVAIRWGLGAAIVAHVVTNLALGLHVIYHGTWGFW
jgi:CAAX prenyl protease-like protein